MAEENNSEQAEEPTGHKKDPAGTLAGSDEQAGRSATHFDEQDGGETLDPDLIKLPRPPTQIRPIMAMAIIAICFVLIARLFDDLSFSREDDVRVVDSIDSLSDEFVDGYIEIEATPDRQQAIRMLPSQKTTGPVLMPVLGHSKTLWLLVHTTPWTEVIRSDERYQGRLSRISDMKFRDELHSYVGNGHAVPRPISLDEVRNALKNGLTEIHDGSAEPFAVDGTTYVRIEEVSTAKIRVRTSMGATHTSEETWRLALQTAGLGDGSEIGGAVSQTTKTWTFEVPARSGIEEVKAMLVAAKLNATKAEEILVTREGTWKDLSLDDEEILLGDAQLGYTLKSISLGLAIDIDDNAYILNTTETPQTYWYMPALVGLLALFASIFAFGIFQHIRERARA